MPTERPAAEHQITASEWAELFADELGIAAPTEEEVNDLLALAGLAAHASERTAAPLSTWLAGRAGVPAKEAKDAAAKVASKLNAEDDASAHGTTAH